MILLIALGLWSFSSRGAADSNSPTPAEKTALAFIEKNSDLRFTGVVAVGADGTRRFEAAPTPDIGYRFPNKELPAPLKLNHSLAALTEEIHKKGYLRVYPQGWRFQLLSRHDIVRVMELVQAKSGFSMVFIEAGDFIVVRDPLKNLTTRIEVTELFALKADLEKFGPAQIVEDELRPGHKFTFDVEGAFTSLGRQVGKILGGAADTRFWPQPGSWIATISRQDTPRAVDVRLILESQNDYLRWLAQPRTQRHLFADQALRIDQLAKQGYVVERITVRGPNQVVYQIHHQSQSQEHSIYLRVDQDHEKFLAAVEKLNRPDSSGSESNEADPDKRAARAALREGPRRQCDRTFGF